MAITASNLVQVLPRILKATGNDLVFNGVVLDSNDTIPSDTPLAFASATEVGEYFGTSSDEYKFAGTYFGGFDNSQVKPATLYFYRLNATASSAWVRGAELDVKTALSTITAISGGSITLDVDGVTKQYTEIDLSDCTSYSDVASKVQTATDGDLTLEYSSQFNAFII